MIPCAPNQDLASRLTNRLYLELRTYSKLVVSGTHFKFERYRPSPTLASLSLIVKTIIDFANLFVDITINEENEDEGNVGEAFEGGGGGHEGYLPLARVH